VSTDRERRLERLSPAKQALLARALRERAARQEGIAPRPAAERGAPAPLSFGQERLWLAQQMDPESPVYNLPIALRVRGKLAPAALAAALSAVVRRHEVLRTAIEPRGEGLVQVAVPARPLPLPAVDLSCLPPALRESEAARLARAEARRPFDLARPPLLRAVVFALGDAEHLLAITLHHVAADGWSAAILVREVGALYAFHIDRDRTDRPSPLPDLPLQYADWASWQRERLAGDRLAAELAFWRERLAGTPTLDLPIDRPRPAVESFRGHACERLLPAPLRAALDELARRQGATLFMTLAAGFLALLGRFCDQEDFAIGTPVAGRTLVATEELIGFFVNTLVLRADLAGDPPFAELVSQVRAALAAAHAHQELPFERLVEALAPPRDAARPPLVQVFFTLETAPREPLALSGLALAPLPIDTGTAKADLGLELREAADGGLVAGLELAADLFDTTTGERLLGHLATLLTGAATAPDLRLSALPLLTRAERHQLVHEWSDGGHLSLLDRHGCPVPIGVPGEVHRRDAAQGGMHPTGERARWSADGRLAPPAPFDRPAPTAATAGQEGKGAVADAAVEALLARLWAELLDLPTVERDADFFALGGHSLLGARLLARVREELGVDLRLRALFEAPTVAGLAAVLGGARGGRAPEPIPRADRDRSQPLPLSFGQQRLWFLHQLRPESPAYNLPVVLRLDGNLDSRALAVALSEVLRRHEALRTAIVARGTGAVQEVAPAAPLPLPVVDLRSLPPAARATATDRLASAEARRTFDLARPPHLRATLMVLAREEHRLLLTLHHVAADGWSSAILIRETAALYRARIAGRPSPLPELPLQYAEWAVWQRAHLAGQLLARELAYWRESLAGLPELRLPTDRPRPVVESFRGLVRGRLLPADLASRLAALSRERGSTLFMILAAGFAALLGRLSGQEDFGLATPVAGRTRRESEGLIGFFVNTLVLRADLAGDPPFSTLLARLRSRVLDAFAHQELPFERLVEELAPRRDLSRQPLAQAFVVLQNTPRAPLALPGLTLSQLPVDNGTAKVDLTLEVEPEGEALRAGLEANRDLFDGATAKRILAQLETLLAGAAAAPETPLAELPLLTAGERHQILIEWGGKEEESAAAPLPDLFVAQARRTPDAIAVAASAGDIGGIAGPAGIELLSYGELDARAERLARHLHGRGVGPEVRVALFLDRSPDLIVALLAVVKAGGAYLPLDPDSPRERLAYLLEDAAAPLVLTRADLAERLGDPGAATLVLLDREPLTADSAAPPALYPDHPAYVIYTSGSTGRPKGVVVTHANATRLFSTTARWFACSADDVWTLFHSSAFDFSVWEIWGALLHGGRLVVVPYWTSRSPDDFLALLAREGVTVLNQTPAAFRQLLRVVEGAGVDLAALRLVLFGGEALDPRHLRPWFDRYSPPGDRRPLLVNLFGITETTVHATYRPLRAADAASGASAVGRPLPDLALRVLDRHLRQVPIGVPGEICIGGAGLARGYLGRPGETAARFVPDPWQSIGRGGEPGSRLYRSGDLGRLRGDGDLEVLGRIDHQVKVRGFRIELGEVEAALLTHPGIRESAAAALESPDGEGERRLVAWVVPRGEEVPAAELRAFLKERLPEPMVPASIVALSALPLTAHGKLDRRALPAPGRAPALRERAFTPPRTPVERAIAASWAAVLDLPRIGLDDDFFALGGDSIRGIQVRVRAEELGVRFTLEQLFRYPTLRELAAALRGAPEAVPGGDSREAPRDLLQPADRARLPAGIADAYPLARTLSGLVFHSEYSPDYLIYATSLHLRAPLDPSLLALALDRVVARHPVLRSSFALSGFSEPLQLVHPECRVPLAVIDFCGLAAAAQERELDRWLAAEARRRFDWKRPPLLRLQVHLRSAETFQLTLSEPFLDGWSVGLFLTELFTRYLALLSATRPDYFPGGLPVEAPDDRPLQSSFRDYVALEREALASPEQRRFWQRRMDEGGAARLPGGPAVRRAGEVPPPVLHLDVPVPEAVSDGLAAAARAASVPLKDLLLAVHLRVLSALTGERAVLTGLLANGRPETADGDRVIGGMLNAMPFRLDLLDLAPSSWLELAKQTFDAERELLPYRRYPLSEILALSEEPAEVGRPPFDTVFNFTHFHVYQRLERIPGLAVLASAGSEQTYFPLTVQANVHELTGRVSLGLDVLSAALPPAEATAIAERYARALAAAASSPDGPHDDLSLLSAVERQQTVAEWGIGGMALDEPDGGLLVHERFAAHAAHIPDARALVWEGSVVTYGELRARSDRLARLLARFLAGGAGPEARVGVLLERSPDLVAAILAVLATGAAYVPLDPAYPAERTARMIAGAAVEVVVTRRALAPLLPPDIAPLLVDLLGEVEPAPAGPPCRRPLPENLFAVIYTSGSTGRPKGVGIAERSVAALLAGAARLFPGADRAGVLAAASVCFDLSFFELFLPLAHGGTVFLAENVLDLPWLPERDSVTLVGIVPSAAAELLRAGPGRSFPESVRAFVLGGEALPPAVARALLSRGHTRVLNHYGPTEATTYSLYTTLDEADAAAPPIGRPAPGERVLLLDPWLQPVLPGVAGEIALGGFGLARGYLGQPERTAERFVPDPTATFRGEPGARLYKTGDLARHLPDGRLEFLGRRDHQVKVRGFRIEPGDVEAALARQPGVAQAVVVARGGAGDIGGTGATRLIAYVVARPAGSTAPEPGWVAALRDTLRESLPPYMVPSAIVPLAALPLTATGKVDRRALPEPAAERGAERPFRPPATPLEEVLAGLWAPLFGLARVSADDDFFALGGHSLLATQLVTRIREACRLELPLAALFAAPRLADLAAEVGRRLAGAEEGEEREGGESAPPLRPEVRPAEIPLSFAQQRLWFLDRLEPGTPLYNVAAAIRLLGPLDATGIAALAGALRAIVRRHEALRTRFPTVDGRPVQEIEATGAAPLPPLPVIDLAGLAAPLAATVAARASAAEARLSFDLARGPLLRLRLFRIAPAEHLLLATAHHIVADGWSIGIFLRELAALYRAVDRARPRSGAGGGEPSPLPALPVQYADFALWQRRWLAGPAGARQLGYWRERLSGVPPLVLPTDRPRHPTHRGARSSLHLPAATTAAIAGLARRSGGTLFMTLLAACATVLGRHAGQEDFALGSPVANRTRREIEGLIGFFVNTLVLRADLAGDPTGGELLDRCRAAALGAYAHQDLPFERLVEELRPERDLARAPLFQVLLVLQNAPLPAPAELALPGLTLAPALVETAVARFDLTLTFSAEGDAERPTLAADLVWNADLFDEVTALRLLGHLAATLAGIAADPERRLSELPLLSPAERQQLFEEWAEGSAGVVSASDLEGDLLIPDLLFEQAARTPRAVAVADAEGELTYGALADRARRLARHLRARGVGPEVVVGIRMERGARALVAMLAVLAAGGAYLPLDPAYPEERLAFMVADAGVRLVLDESSEATFESTEGTKLSLAGGRPLLPDHTAYVIYTSGSTGRPKGVAITHRGLLRSTRARFSSYSGRVSAFLLLPSFAFDSSVAVIYWTLCQGGCLVLPEEGRQSDPAYLASRIDERAVSHWLSIPALYALVLDLAEPRALAALRTVIVAGEACPESLVLRHRARLPGAGLYNEYGPTEATVWATLGTLLPGVRVTIGRPIPGLAVHLLDRDLAPVPIGVAAEVFLGGPNLARGYLGWPEATAERFLPDPAAGGTTAPGGRLYRTGDLARWLPDGRLDFLGRADHQVKIRGFRIEPGEVEAALERHPNVRQAAVLVREPHPGSSARRLAGCFVPAGELTADELHRFLADHLPAHMVPAELVSFPALPLLPNGKVDRAALASLLPAADAPRPPSAPPADGLERRLAALWAELLGLPAVGREEGFFALGGHSLLAVQLLARIERDIVGGAGGGRSLPLAALFRGATVASLAAALREEGGPPLARPLVALRRGGLREPFFWVHPLGGRALCYADLVRQMADRPVYGLESADEPGGPAARIEDLAARYVDALGQVQAAGPSLLGGWSFGGVIAWEMARQLAERGRAVGLLVLLDTAFPAFPETTEPPQLDDATLDALLRAEPGAGSLAGPALAGLRATVRAHLAALAGYRPRPLSCPVAFFRAEEAPASGNGAARAWRSLHRGPFAVRGVAADHYGLLREPGVRKLATALDRLLQKHAPRNTIGGSHDGDAP
jgi:amino acid adenylation domain-containing protein